MTDDNSITAHIGKTYMRRRGKRVPSGLSIVQPDAAGIDVGARRHYVSVPDGRDTHPIQHFGCYTEELTRMAQWLIRCGVRSVVMEATGVYWLPVFRVLEEHGLEVVLVNPRHVKYVPGRKTDVADCDWLRQLHTFGLLHGAFVPPQHVAAMRAYWRHRRTLVEASSCEIQHMQKALTQMNLHLHVVLSDIAGVSGLKILRAIVAGQRDPRALADLAHATVKASRDEIIQALSGHYTKEHLFILRQCLERFDAAQSQIAECDQELAIYLNDYHSKAEPKAIPASTKRSKHARRKNEPHFDLRTELYRMTGVDLTRIDGIDSMTAFTVISEIGPDVSAFASEKQFASWLGLCPNNRITGGKVKRRSTLPVYNNAANALRIAAQALHHSKSYLGAHYRRMRARLGAPKAITATAHKLARLIYRMLKHGEDYVDKGEKHLEQIHRERSIKALARHARELGFTLVQNETGECLA